MARTIRLTVLTGPHKGRRFCFRGATQCLLGRADDCFVKFCGTARDRLISRHHCQLDIDPSCIHVRDLRSSNGTYINGRRVEPILDGADAASLGAVLNDGDVLGVDGTTLRVDIVDCPPAGTQAEGLWNAGDTAKKDCPLSC
jgi:eukaryotic-like serine/threonine-protein kinase